MFIGYTIRYICIFKEFVAVAHQDGLDAVAVGQTPEVLDGPVLSVLSVQAPKGGVAAMTDLRSMTLQELTDWCREQGQPAFRGKQLFQWFARGLVQVEYSSTPPGQR